MAMWRQYGKLCALGAVTCFLTCASQEPPTKPKTLGSTAAEPAAGRSAQLGHTAAGDDDGPPSVRPAARGEIALTAHELQNANLTVVSVGMAQFHRTVVAAGRVAPIDLRIAHVVSPVNGRLTRLVGNFGQAVRRGAPLAVIDSPDLASAVSDVARARADLAQATAELQRQRALFAAHAGPERDLDAAIDARAGAKGEADRANKRLRLLRSNQTPQNAHSYTLTAPIDGHIISRSANLGDEIQGQYDGGSGMELFVVADLREVWVLGEVHEADAGRIAPGQAAVVVTQGGAPRMLAGKVDWVADTLDVSSHTIEIRSVVQNADGYLRPDMLVTLRVSVPGVSQLAVPRDAVVGVDGVQVAFVADSGGAHFLRRPVIVDDDPREEILAVVRGLAAGERVICGNAAFLAAKL